MNNYDELRQAAEAVIDIGIATNATEWHIIDHFQDLASAEVILALLDENAALRAALEQWLAWVESLKDGTAEWLSGPTLEKCAVATRQALGDAS